MKLLCLFDIFVLIALLGCDVNIRVSERNSPQNVGAETDNDGGATDDSATLSFSKDTGKFANNANYKLFEIDGSCYDSAEPVIVVLDSITVEVSCEGNLWKIALDTSKVDEGPFKIVIEQKKSDNIVSDVEMEFIKDTSSPLVTIDAAPYISLINENNFGITGTCSEEAKKVLLSAGGTQKSVSCSSEVFSAEFDFSDLSALDVTVSAKQIDDAGNESEATSREFSYALSQDKFNLTHVQQTPASRRIHSRFEIGPASDMVPATATIKLYKAATRGALDFSGASVASASGDTEYFEYHDVTADTSFYVGMKVTAPGGKEWIAPESWKVDFTANTMQHIHGGGTLNAVAADPFTDSNLVAGRFATPDDWGNIIYAPDWGYLRVLCNENINAPYCKAQEIGKIRKLLGGITNDGTADRGHNIHHTEAAVGLVDGVDIDAQGNIFMTDRSYHRIRVLCFEVTAPGACNGKTLGYIYSLAGDGVQADGADNSVASSTSVYQPIDVALDSHGNILASEYYAFRMRLICINNTAGSLCAGKTVGNSYHFAGTGVTGDGADNADPTVTAIGSPLRLTIDANNNVYFTDYSYHRIRVVCYEATASGFCNGKTPGNMYQFGSGNSDGADDVAAASVGLGHARGIAIDSDNNVFVPDDKYFYVRAFCFNTSVSGFCSGKTVNNHYIFSGTGSKAHGTSGDDIATASIYDPNNLSVDSHGNLVMYDGLIKTFCINNEGVCDEHPTGKLITQVSSVSNYPEYGAPVPVSEFSSTWKTFLDSKGNIYSYGNYSLFVACWDITGTSICTGKKQGFAYRVSGTGVRADPSNDVAAKDSALGEIRGLVVAPDNNIYIGDYYMQRVVTVCVSVNSGGFCQGKTSGNVYHMVGTGVTATSDVGGPMGTAPIAWPQTLDFDAQGNLYIGAFQSWYRINVACLEVNSGGFCQGKTQNELYVYVGGGANYLPETATDRLDVRLPKIYNMQMDSHDNLFFSDYHYPGENLTVVCHTTTLGGICAGKTLGAVYTLAGQGSPGDGGDDVVAITASIGRQRSIAIDSHDNVYSSDENYRKYRAFCFNTGLGTGFCDGKTTDNMYYWAGIGDSYNKPESGTIFDQSVFHHNMSHHDMAFDANDVLFFKYSKSHVKILK